MGAATGGLLPPQALGGVTENGPRPRRRRARSARVGGRQSPPSTAPRDDDSTLPPAKVGGYLVGLRNYRDDLNPYLAEPTPMLAKPIAKLGALPGRVGRVGAPSMPSAKEGGGVGAHGVAAQLLHEQQLRILSSLYGAPLRCFGVPASAPTGGPAGFGGGYEGGAAGGGYAPFGGAGGGKVGGGGLRGPPAGGGAAVVREMRNRKGLEEAEPIS